MVIAVILAAGKGIRLRPMTYDVPKSMVPIGNKPLLEYTIELLKKYSIEDIIITTSYLANQIHDYFKDGSRFGVNILYTVEKQLLGTAGGTKKIQNFLNDTFILIYGDNFTNIDLTKLLEYHKKKGGLITLALYEEKDNPASKGLVEMDDNGKITKFVEKPEKAFTTLANAAIYVIEPEVLKYIPENTFFDFGKDLFPLLLKKGIPIYGIKTDYLVDIGTHPTYRRANNDVKEGLFKL